MKTITNIIKDAETIEGMGINAIYFQLRGHDTVTVTYREMKALIAMSVIQDRTVQKAYKDHDIYVMVLD